MPVLERAGQIATVREAVATAKGGEGSLLLVAGEPGVGKTTLVRAAVDQLPGRVGCWWGACDPLATPRPLGPWEDMAVREPALASVLHDQDQAQVASVVLALLREPTVVVVEDVHWVDEATVDLLLFLGRRLQRCRSVLVVTYRPLDVAADQPAARLLGQLARVAEARAIQVEPLTVDAVAQLAEGSGLDPAALHRQTGGNAFYVTEVLADPTKTVPGTVADAVRARLVDLPPGGRQLLDMVCLTPSGLEYTVAAELLGEQATRVGLDQVAARGTAGLDGGRIVFRHELARMAVEDALLPGRRRQLHTALLDELESTAGTDPARLVHHAVEAGDPERILAHARTAADAAEARGAYRVAAAHLERAIEVADHLPAREQAELWERLADQRILFEDFTAQVDLREQVVRRWQQVGDREREALQRCFLAGTLAELGDRSRAAEVLDRARALVADRPFSPAARTVRATWLNTLDGRRPAREQAEAWEQLDEDARRAEDHETRVWALAQAAVAHVRLGNVDRALHLLDRGAELAEHTHRPAAVGHTNVGEALCQCRHHELAERLLQPALDDERRDDAATLARYAATVLARAHLERGRWADARSTASPIEEDPGTDPLAWALAVAVLDRLEAHETASISEQLPAAWELVRDTENIDFMWPVAVACAEAAWGRGDPAAAADPVLATLDVARATEHPWAVGELTWWARQAGHDAPVEVEVAEPWAAALSGDWVAAADAWAALGCPLDEAIALAAGDLPAQRRALNLFTELGATADADRLRQRLRDAGATDLPARDRPRAAPDSVTARQLQVLELVAAGLTNAAIAERLYITEKTVGHHVSAILARLDARTRTQAVAVARERGLLTD